MEPLDHIFQSLKPLASEAQIILEVTPGSPSADRVREILGPICNKLTEYNAFNTDQPTYLKILVPANALHEAILQLTKAGYSKIMGLDAVP
jgi:hypothetical protein